MDGEMNMLERLFQVITPGVFGILSVLIGVSGDILAAIHFPGYNITKNMISDLGVGPGGIFFNAGVILSGIFAIPYMIHLGNVMRENENMTEKTVNIAVGAGIISSIALSLIGVFPAIEENFTILLIHGIIATICYLTGVTYLCIYGYYMRDDERFPIIFPYFALGNAVLFTIVTLTWIPLLQWIANIGIIIWTFSISSYILHKKL